MGTVFRKKTDDGLHSRIFSPKFIYFVIYYCCCYFCQGGEGRRRATTTGSWKVKAGLLYAQQEPLHGAITIVPQQLYQQEVGTYSMEILPTRPIACPLSSAY